MVSRENPVPAPISLQPRQVMIKKTKEKRKEKEDHSSEILENGSNAETLEPNREKEEKEKKKKKKKRKIMEFAQLTPVVLQSIAAYLDSNGFSKTLSALRSETSLEIDGLKAQSLDLEAVFGKYLETSSEYPIEANGKDLKKQDPCENLNAQYDVEPKKKKKNNGSDANKETNGNVPNGVNNESGVENKVKEIKSESKKSKSDLDDDVDNMMLEKSPIKPEKKKKKSRTVSDSLGEDDLKVVPGTIQGAANADLGKLPKKSKDRKGKNKLISEPADNVQQDSPALSEAIKKKPKDLQGPELVIEAVPVEIPLDDIKSKDKKKKVESLSSSRGHAGDLNGIDTEKEDVLFSEGNVVAVEKKSSKKRKRPATEELNSRADDDNACGTEPNKIDGFKEKIENEKLEDSTKAKEEPSAHGSKKEADGLPNGILEKNGKHTTPKTTKKELDCSAEPKKVSSFQRVKVDEVKFVDDRLQDNSYWAKSGADSGYGAKAQEVLGQVKGRDFRHEKTKKKRGSYRGGQIDFNSHSIKFNYSDEE